MYDLKELQPLLEQLSQIEYIDPAEIPGIDLYMDQVTTFMDSHLESAKRHSQDKILTKTMINNYAKNDLLPPPTKKKYSKEHILLLTYIYYLKSFLSIGDIQTLLTPLNEKYFGRKGQPDLEAIYRETMTQHSGRMEELSRNLQETLDRAGETFPEAPEEERGYLQLMSFVSALSLDVYLKKYLIEQIIDSMIPQEPSKKTKKEK